MGGQKIPIVVVGAKMDLVRASAGKWEERMMC